MDNAPEPESVQMDNLKLMLDILHTELSRQVKETFQESRDQVQSGLIRTFDELDALKADVKSTKALLEGLTAFHNNTTPKEREQEFIQVVQVCRK
jgi:hypothetical protein